MIEIKKAFISVADKTGLVKFAQELAKLKIELIATGGTAEQLIRAGLTVTRLDSKTGFSPMLSGRIKTLHPALLGGILADRDQPEHLSQVAKLDAELIDLVVVNFYPFAEAVAAGKKIEELIENIDIGGPTMVRSAAKNHRYVAVVVDPQDYPNLVRQIVSNQGKLPKQQSAQLAIKAFATVANYDSQIAAGLQIADDLPATLNLHLERIAQLRYGENPDQRAAIYGNQQTQLNQFTELPVSYNNLQDAIAAWRCVAEYQAHACTIIKHATPCGVAVAANQLQAYQQATAADPISAYGGIVAFNQPLEVATAAALSKNFIEVLVVPQLSEAAAKHLATKKKLRIIQGPLANNSAYDVRSYGGLTLVQSIAQPLDERKLNWVCGDADKQTAEQLLFAWRVCAHTKSNAIVLANNSTTIGIGSGQTSRLMAAQLAVQNANNLEHQITGSVAASDGFLPFADTLEILAKAGVAALIQPGGSKRDNEVIAAADKVGMKLVFTYQRRFNH